MNYDCLKYYRWLPDTKLQLLCVIQMVRSCEKHALFIAISSFVIDLHLIFRKPIRDNGFFLLLLCYQGCPLWESWTFCLLFHVCTVVGKIFRGLDREFQFGFIQSLHRPPIYTCSRFFCILLLFRPLTYFSVFSQSAPCVFKRTVTTIFKTDRIHLFDEENKSLKT